MARADYKLCDVCGEKAFYDASLNYETGPHGLRDLSGRDISLSLDYCAQVGAVCTACYDKGWRIKVENAVALQHV